MTSSRFFRSLWLAAGMAIGLLFGCGWQIAPASAGEPETGANLVRDEPAAHALYNQMIDAMQVSGQPK